MLRQASLSTLFFIGISLLTGFGLMEGIDRWGLDISDSIACCPIEIIAFIFSILGSIEVTGMLTLVLVAILWCRHSLQHGLIPLLLFVGVALEAMLKYFIIHPRPPHITSQNLCYFDFPNHIVTYMLFPYSFPSGHVLRTTFLVELFIAYMNRYHIAGRVLIIMMALTRVYLNDHWISDVVGGFLLGLALASVAVLLLREDFNKPLLNNIY
jgi:undecaprenyl-diphosphatase